MSEQKCQCGGELVGEKAIPPLTDDNPMTWHRLWFYIDQEVEKGAKFCEKCHQIYPSLK